MIRYLLVVSLFASAVSASAEPLVFHNGRLFIAAKVNDVATEASSIAAPKRPSSTLRLPRKRGCPKARRRS
jgi:hypothetical protein